MQALLLRVTLALSAPATFAAQSRATRLIDSAYAQARAGRLDSAGTLLRPLLDSSARVEPQERASAQVVYGIVEYFKGRDSGAVSAFRAALELRLDLRGDWMFQLDSGLGRLWRRERGRAICGMPEPAAFDFLASDSAGAGPPVSVLKEKPRILSGPNVRYPEHLRRARIQGRVVVAAVIDTSGHAEPGSIKIVQSPHRDFGSQAKRYLEQARFQPGRIGTRPVRVCVEVPVDFRIRE
jgi:TonB family protein